ncbi:MAG: branched-chain amino acid ABC transporter permease [Pseudomonadota bacterium]
MSGRASPVAHWLRGPVTGTLILAIPLMVVALLALDAGSLTTTRVVTIFFINIVLAVGLQSFIGLSGLVSLGHVAFMAIGAYAAGILVTPMAVKATSIPDAPAFLVETVIGFAPSLLVAAIVAMVIAVIVGPIMVRLSVAAAPIATLSMMIVVSVLLSNSTAITRGDQTFYGIPRNTGILTAATVSILVIFIARCLRDSGIGLSLRSSRKDELSARANGVNVFWVRLVAWVLSAGIMAIGGALYAQQLGAISPKLFLYDITFLVLSMVVLGGRSIAGAVVGVALVSIVVEILRRVETGISIAGHDLNGLANVGLGVIIIATMLLRSDGIMGSREFDEMLGRRKPRE